MPTRDAAGEEAGWQEGRQRGREVEREREREKKKKESYVLPEDCTVPPVRCGVRPEDIHFLRDGEEGRGGTGRGERQKRGG